MNPPSQPVLPPVPNTAVWESEEEAAPPIPLIPLLRSFVVRWPLLLLVTVAGAVVLFALSFLARPEYHASAVFLPPENRPLMSDNPFAALWSNTDTGTRYPGLLKSDSVVDVVLHDLNLQTRYKARDIEQARTILRAHTEVSSDTAGFYTLTVSDPEPAMAKAIADKYLYALMQTNTRLAVDEADQEQKVYEQELSDAKDNLERAETELAETQKSSGVVSPQTQTLSGLRAIELLRSQITQLQVSLAALREAETDQAPAVVKLRSQIGVLQTQLAAMESGNGGGAGAGLSAARAPELNLEFLKLQREVQYRQSLYEILIKQFESTQMQAISTPAIQVVDYPELPLRKATPRRRLWALVGAILAFFVAMIAVFVEDRYRVMQQDENRREELALLAEAARKPAWHL